MATDDKRTVKLDVGERGLKQHDLRVSTVVFMIFSLVAAGAYGIEEMIPASGAGLTLVMLMVLPFVWGLPFGLVASELGSARPQEGGYYKWVQEALGEFWGFQAGWWRTISVYIDNTLYVMLAGGYLASQWDLNGYEEYAIKAAIIIIFTYINIRGIKDVGMITTILSILVIAAFAIVAIAGFSNWESNPFTPFTSHGEIMGVAGIGFGEWIMFIGAGLAIGMWMYSGYESMSTMAGEVKNPQVIPKATLLTIPLIMAVYILPTMAGLASIGSWDSWGIDAESIGYADVVTTFWGTGFGIFFVVIAVLAQCSIYNTYIASGSRGFFALADDHLAPPLLVKVDKKHGVPYVAVLSVALVNLILCRFRFQDGHHRGRVSADLVVHPGVHLGDDPQEETSRGSVQVQDPRRISVSRIALRRAHHHRSHVVLRQRHRLLHRRPHRYSHRTGRVRHLEAKVRRSCQEGSGALPVQSTDASWGRRPEEDGRRLLRIRGCGFRGRSVAEMVRGRLGGGVLQRDLLRNGISASWTTSTVC